MRGLELHSILVFVWFSFDIRRPLHVLDTLLMQSKPGVDKKIAVLHELNMALTMASGHPSQNRLGGVVQALVPLLSGANNEVGKTSQ